MPNRLALLVLTAFALSSPPTSAQGTASATDRDDDAAVTLTVLTEISPGLTDWCEIEVIVTGQDVALTIGDTIQVSLWEDDLVGDDLLFSTVHVVTGSETTVQLVSLVLDCSVDPGLIAVGIGSVAQIYAEALVDKDECGTFCMNDNPTTSNISVTITDPVQFIRGDANGDGLFDIGDPITVLDHLFAGSVVTCALALDANDDELVNIADGISILGSLFSSGPPPAPPFTGCGTDPTPGTLDCVSHAACP